MKHRRRPLDPYFVWLHFFRAGALFTFLLQIFSLISMQDGEESYLVYKHLDNETLPSFHRRLPRTTEEAFLQANALFTLMLNRGEPFFNVQGDFPPPSNDHPGFSRNNLTIDIVSIGTQTNLRQMEAQSQTWASHHMVRYFFGVTEADDADPTCFVRLSREDMVNVSNHCVGHGRFLFQHSNLMRYQTNSFAHDEHLAKKGPGWMCNFRRMSHAWGKLGRFYRVLLEVQRQTGLTHRDRTLPDYVLVVDDDSYYNLQVFERDIATNDPSVPLAEAGCLIQSPLHIVNFSFPFGGFGVTVSRGALQNMLRPIDCRSPANDFNQHVCLQLQDNIIGEQPSFQDGMSLSDLMDAHASRDFYTEFYHFKRALYPFCVHSDWVLGVYFNYYQVTEHVSHPLYNNPARGQFFEHNPRFRIGSRLGILYKKPRHNPPRNCRYGMEDHRQDCPASAQLCHRQTPERMANMTPKSNGNYRLTTSPVTWYTVEIQGVDFRYSSPLACMHRTVDGTCLLE
jgi:hypothetical protein